MYIGFHYIFTIHTLLHFNYFDINEFEKGLGFNSFKNNKTLVPFFDLGEFAV